MFDISILMTGPGVGTTIAALGVPDWGPNVPCGRLTWGRMIARHIFCAEMRRNFEKKMTSS